MFFKNLFARWQRDSIRHKIQALVKIEENLRAVENEKQAMEKKNPLVGKVGLMLGMGSPPPGFESTIQAEESRYKSLIQKLSSLKTAQSQAKARLSTLTGKNFERSSEWNEWFNTKQQKGK